MQKSYMALGAQVPSSPSIVILLLLCQNYKPGDAHKKIVCYHERAPYYIGVKQSKEPILFIPMFLLSLHD
ncbi:hypothetical protein VNO80_18672 [Phaseolus coccineus]|uniref:Uncharacterized protein n=1 Tax=Phaseolus coccineus TaxID=3886 RepID=A0AAN9MFS7_PHACN